MRIQHSNSMNLLEQKWWETFSELETYTWSNSSPLFIAARKKFLDTIAQYIETSDLVIDMGCGNGTLSREIAKRTGKKIIGFDFSEAQIKKAKDHNFEGCHFICGGADEIIRFINSTKEKIALICSGFLHHLSDEELRSLTSKINELDPERVEIVLCEPVVFPRQKENDLTGPLLSGIEGIVNSVDSFAAKLGFEQTDHTKALKELSAQRWWGRLPYGPSPKEKPFDVEELNNILGDCYHVDLKIVNYLGGSIHFASQCNFWSKQSLELINSKDVLVLFESVTKLEYLLLESPMRELPDRGWYFAVARYQRH